MKKLFKQDKIETKYTSMYDASKEEIHSKVNSFLKNVDENKAYIDRKVKFQVINKNCNIGNLVYVIEEPLVGGHLYGAIVVGCAIDIEEHYITYISNDHLRVAQFFDGESIDILKLMEDSDKNLVEDLLNILKQYTNKNIGVLKHCDNHLKEVSLPYVDIFKNVCKSKSKVYIKDINNLESDMYNNCGYYKDKNNFVSFNTNRLNNEINSIKAQISKKTDDISRILISIDKIRELLYTKQFYDLVLSIKNEELDSIINEIEILHIAYNNKGTEKQNLECITIAI